MKYRVVFSAEGFDNSAYFDCECECKVFARLMAEAGRLIRVQAEGKDTTSEFVKVIHINGVK